MRRKLSIEFIKLLERKNYILLGLLVFCIVGPTLVFFKELKPPIDQYIYRFFSFVRPFISFFMSVFIIMNIGQEYQEKTLKKNIIDGYSRNDFFVGKLLIFTIVIISVCFFQLLTLLLVVGIFQGFNQIISAINPFIVINFFFQIFYLGLFALCLIYLIKSTFIAIIVYFIWGILEKVVSMLFFFIIEGKEIFTLGASQNINIHHFEKVLPLSIVQNTLSSYNSGALSLEYIVIITLYVFIMLSLPYYLFLSQDIK